MSNALRLSVREYDRMVQKGAFNDLDRRIEFIRGELREMNPAGPVHDDLIGYLTRWSTSVTSAAKVAIRIQSGLDLPEQESRPEPDLLWVTARRYFERHPRASEVLLAIEVAESSLQSDLTEKATLYAEAGIVEYWIVDVPANCVHTFAEPREGTYQTQRHYELGESVSPRCLPDARLDISDLFGKA